MWSTWALRLGGFLFLALFACLVLTFVFSLLALSDAPDYSRDEVAETLADIEDDKAAYTLSIALDVLSNFLAVSVAAILYVLLRNGPWYVLSSERPDIETMAACPRAVALIPAFGITVAATLFLVADLANIVLYRLAIDFREGGVEGTGQEDILQNARTVGLLGEAAIITGLSALGASLILFGGLIAFYPLAHTDPAGAYRTVPRWLGWLAIIGGLFMLLGWLTYLDEDIGMISFVGAQVGVGFVALLGLWFLFFAGREVPSGEISTAA